MRIAVFDNLPEGGAKRVVFEQIKYLSTNHTVIYFTSNQQSSFLFEKYVAEIKRFPLELRRFTGMLRPLQELQLLRLYQNYKKIAAAIDAAKIDVVLVHHCQVTQSPLLLQTVKAYKIPTLYYIEEPLRICLEPALFPIEEKNYFKKLYEVLRRKIIKNLDNWSCDGADMLMANSDFTKVNVATYYQRQAITIHPGVDTTVFKPVRQKRQYFLSIGEKEYINGADLLAAAEKLLPSYIAIKHITFKNKSFRVSDRELADIYTQSYATLCLSHREPFGLTSIESQACGTLVIAVAEGGYKETVTTKSGILIDRNPEQLAAAIVRVYEDSKLRSILTTESIKNAHNFNWQSHGRKLEKYLRSLVK